MKPGYIIAAVVAAAILAFGIFMIDVDMTEEARLPDVDLSIEGGNMPEFQADVGDIDLGTEEVTVQVPTVDIESPEESREDG